MQAARPTAPSDDELAARARTGNQEAFAALYDRYFPGVFDLAVRVVRNRETAANVVQMTFATAWSALRAQGPAESVKASLYTVARDYAIDELRKSKRGGSRLPAEAYREGIDFTRVDANRVAETPVLADKELLEVTWDAAEAQSPEEYSLLDLHVRRGLKADDLAVPLGMKAAAVDARLRHLVDGFDDSVRTALLARRGQQDSPEVEGLASRLSDYSIAGVRSAVETDPGESHDTEETRAPDVSPTEILKSFAPVPPTPGLHWQIWRGVDPDAEEEDRPVRARRARRWFPWRRST